MTLRAAITVRLVLVLPAGLVALIATSQLRPAIAGTDAWTTSGPPGVYVRALVVDPTVPSTVYAGTNGGLFKSVDAGASWMAINNGLNADPRTIYASALAIDPVAPSTLYAGITKNYGGYGDYGGVYESTDGGAGWFLINSGFLNVEAISVDPINTSTLYVAKGEIPAGPPGFGPGGVIKSLDGGTTWTALPLNLGFGYSSVTAFAINPKTPTTLYAGTASGVFKSTDGGGSWTSASNGIFPEGFGGAAFIEALALDPSRPEILWAATSGGGVYRSTSGGVSWIRMTNGLSSGTASSPVYAFAIDPLSNSCTVFAGVAGGGVYLSTNGGGSWAAMNNGLSNTYVYALALAPSSPPTLYAGTQGGVFAIQQSVAPKIAARSPSTHIAGSTEPPFSLFLPVVGNSRCT
jgi:photosystem II stability/assembly factor-like uncharacterized protein